MKAQLLQILHKGGILFDKRGCFLSLGSAGAPAGAYRHFNRGVESFDPIPQDPAASFRFESDLYFLRPRRGDKTYAIARLGTDGRPVIDLALTRQVFRLELEPLEQLVLAYGKALRCDFGDHNMERVTCSTRENTCDLSGTHIPADFPYISLEEQRYLGSHLSLGAFFSLISLATMGGDPRSPATRLMTEKGVTPATWKLLYP